VTEAAEALTLELSQPPAAETRSRRDHRSRLEGMFRAHHEVIWRLFRRMGFEQDLACDLTQQVFLIAAERLTDIRDQSERAFLFGTAVRLTKTTYRRRRRVVLDEDMDARPDPVPLHERDVEQHRARLLVDRILSTMPAELVAVFVLFELEGYSTPEIARDLAIPIGTAASRLRRAREIFRRRAARAEQGLHREVGS
jgi:RNA polymerase sigma-70 factor, ECF subfamily